MKLQMYNEKKRGRFPCRTVVTMHGEHTNYKKILIKLMILQWEVHAYQI